MTTKRKAILKAIALAGSATVDDLCLSIGMERKNAYDNIKATIKNELIERIRDDVTGQPAYKLTPKGSKWLEDDKNDESCVKPQAQVGTNSASKDTGSTVGSSGISADPLPVCNAVSAPPKPDKKPVAACADVKLELADLVFKQDQEIKALMTDLQATALRGNTLAKELVDAKVEIEMLQLVINENVKRIVELESNAELPLHTQEITPRYIVTNSYAIAKNESEANNYAINLAKEADVDTPVMVLQSHKARELRINWRDA